MVQSLGPGVRLAGFESISNQPCDPGQIIYSSSLSSASSSVKFSDTLSKSDPCSRVERQGALPKVVPFPTERCMFATTVFQ